MKRTTTEKILLGYDPEPKNILPALKEISAGFAYISEKDAQKAARYFSVPLSKVYETASFYDQIKTEKKPLAVIQVCGSTHCAISKSFEIVSEIENYFHIKAGDENNSKVKLEIISCLGRCGEGPIVVINDKVYSNVTRSSVVGILEEWL